MNENESKVVGVIFKLLQSEAAEEQFAAAGVELIGVRDFKARYDRERCYRLLFDQFVVTVTLEVRDR
jgi:hypothetical protein